MSKGVINVEHVISQCFDKNGKPYPRLRPYPKTASSVREQPVPPKAIVLLRRLKAAHNAKLPAAGMTAAPDLVFNDPNLSYGFICVGQARLPRISSKNCCRATFATLLADNGTPTHAVQRLLRHSSGTSVTVRHSIATLDESLDRARHRAGGEG